MNASQLRPPPRAGDYQVLVVDPPWNQGKTGRRRVRPRQGTRLDYPTMTRDQIEGLPVPDWSAPQSFLWLWATNSRDRASDEPILPMAFGLMEGWGYRYYTMITWNKRTGPCPFGPYQIITEHVLFGYRGRAEFPRQILGKLKTLFAESPTSHSVKPASFYQDIALSFPGPRLDVFARQRRPGYDGWGNEYPLA